MSTLALAFEPPPAVRVLEPHHEGAGADLEKLEHQIRELRRALHNSLSITYREAALADAFHALAEEWRSATRFQSSLTQVTGHDAYRSIIGLGDEIVPVLLRELCRQPEPWFAALREITGAEPVLPHQRGDMRAMADAWLRWGRQQGLIR